MVADGKNHAAAEDFPNYCQRVSKDSLSLPMECRPLKTWLMRSLTYISLFLMCLLFASCQKVAVEDDVDVPEGKNLVTFNVGIYQQLPFTEVNAAKTRAQDIASLCKHLDLAVYQGGERVAKASKDAGDKDFNTLSISLNPGTYHAVILAHNQDKSPTTTDAEKITFNSDMSDTFLWSQDITVAEDKGLDVDVNMHRAVAMVRIVTTDVVPDNVSTVQLYYTGGSSTLNAMTGEGCVNSRQTVKRTISDDMKGKTATFEIYTFPKSDSKGLKLVVTAIAANGQTVFTHTFENVPVVRNQVTQYKGALFTNGSAESDTSSKFRITTDDEWTTVDKTF